MWEYFTDEDDTSLVRSNKYVSKYVGITDSPVTHGPWYVPQDTWGFNMIFSHSEVSKY